MTPASRQHAVPGGASAIKPPPREETAQLAPPPARPAAPGSASRPDEQPRPSATNDEVPPPPPAARRHPREQLNTKIRVDLRARLNDFVDRHESTLQGVLEAALDEYMARRSWSWDDYHRSANRR